MAKANSLLDRVPLAPVIGAMIGLAFAVLVAALPTGLLDAALGTGLGAARHFVAVVITFVVAGGVVWLTIGAIERATARPVHDADADALDLGAYTAPLPRRTPIFADRDLGAPFMSDAALATAALPEPGQPNPAKPNPADSDPADSDERVHTSHLADPVLVEPLIEEASEPVIASGEPERHDGAPEIDALIRRLEAGLARRGDRTPPSPGGPADPPREHSWLVREDGRADDTDEAAARSLLTRRRLAR